MRFLISEVPLQAMMGSICNKRTCPLFRTQARTPERHRLLDLRDLKGLTMHVCNNRTCPSPAGLEPERRKDIAYWLVEAPKSKHSTLDTKPRTLDPEPRRGSCFFFFFITLGLEMSDTKSHEP